ncbi:hypothetical protein DY000_02039424 [Brassica cretica]|uniref:Uncharacterized protein n=1 Tax=Brassica cretica TaxID=69181 RepID=A0ABQ7BLM1_BRACR|nr:hypothetical protein DY000_02039424 [Brassica cretica]
MSDFLAKTARTFHRELLFIGCSIPVCRRIAASGVRWRAILLPFISFSSLPPYPLLSACRYAYTLAVTAGSRVQICGHRDVAFPVIGSLCGGEACLDGKDSGVGFLGLRCMGNPIFRYVLGFHFFLGLEARVGLCSLSRIRSRLGSSSVWSGVVGISPFVLAEIPVSCEASGLGSARGDVYAQASLAGKASPSLTFLPHGIVLSRPCLPYCLEQKWVIFGALSFPLPVVVRRLGFPSTDIAKLSGVDTNQLKQRCRKAKITKTWSHVSSKVPAPFGNATLGQAPASGSASFLYC